MIAPDSKFKIITVPALLLSLACLTISCKPQHEATFALESSQPPVAVQTVILQSKQVAVFEEVVGTVRPHMEARVSAKVTGRILRMSAVPGMKVKKGAVLAEIEVEEMKASLERAQAAKENADSDLQRYSKLLSAGAATQAEFDAVQSRQRMAIATVKETEVMIGHASVQVPFDGTITQKYMDIGDLASPQRPLFSVEDSELLRLEIHVAETLANQVELGQKFRVVVDGAVADLIGKVAEISPSADTGSRTFLVKLNLQKNEALRAGQFGRAFLPRSKRKALKIPVTALIQRGQMDYVFVVSNDSAHLRIVRTNDEKAHSSADSGSKSEDKLREILAGLEDGETVVLSPPPELRDGQRVITGKSPAAAKDSAQKTK